MLEMCHSTKRTHRFLECFSMYHACVQNLPQIAVTFAGGFVLGKRTQFLGVLHGRPKSGVSLPSTLGLLTSSAWTGRYMGCENMCFCETNRIGRWEVIIVCCQSITVYANGEGFYNPVRFDGDDLGYGKTLT